MSGRVDSFSSLDDLRGRDRSNIHVVLQTIMKNGGRFSVFDAHDMPMARSLTRIEASGWTRRDEARSAYPWVYIHLTEAGEAALRAAA
jgi:DNA-binding HxlR family transcriptional regulator